MSAPFEPSGFFAFRSPLLPFDELEAWADGLEAASALDDPEKLEQALMRDRARLRAWLRDALARPEIAEAVFLASPALVDAAGNWYSDPDSRKGKRAEDSLVRYLQRMACRPTPFGLFSGCSLGTIDGTSSTQLRLTPRTGYQRHTRLDMDYLFALCEDLGRNPALRRELAYRPNSSLYRAAGRLRYAEARLAGKARSHLLVALQPTPYLEATLARAADRVKPGALAAALVAADPDGEVTLEEAEEYVDQLIETQVLVSDLTPAVTGPEAIHGLEEQLAALPGGRVAAALTGARETLAALDANGLGAAADQYRSIAETLRELPTSVELSRLFQVDLVKPAAEMHLGTAVVEELQRGLSILHRLFGRSRQEMLERFRQDFADRYGDGRWVPLAEVLDDETGIGFDRGERADSSPIIAGLDLGRQHTGGTVPWGPLQAWQLRKLEAALARGEQEIELTEQDVERLAVPESNPLPDALETMAVLAARSEEDANAGRFQLLWKGSGGPSGGRILGRFCHADDELEIRLREHLAAEEAARPDAIFAEIVHLPQGRIGNILSRPVLRDYEIPFLGNSGAPSERQIPLSDLVVTVAEQRIVLRSKRLGREVIPRLTSAHNFTRGLGIYRFLCGLQEQGVIVGLSWSWGALEGASFLPRVRSGRLVLQRARWRLSEDEIKALCTGSSSAQFAAVQRLRAERRMPRRVLVADGDNELLVDFDNVLSVEAGLDVLDGRREAFLFELFPGPEELCARGPEGRFVHELVVPFVRSRPAKARVHVSTAAPVVAVQRSFLPGSEWLYAKLYLGASTADAVLRDVVGPVTRDLQASGVVDSWFFIRYSDPHWHLRVRFHGDPRGLTGEALPALEAAVAPLLQDGRLWRMQLDTYDREIERYGGPSAIALAERIFHADSEAALAIVDLLDGDETADARWRLAVCGIDLLLADLGLDADGKRAVLGQVRDGFFREFGGGKPLRVLLDQKQRAERRTLEALLDSGGGRGDLAFGLAILRNRTERIAPLVAELRRLEQARRLTMPVTQIAPSLVHMHVNRLIRAAQRPHELVLYDLLGAIYDSRAARAGRREKEVRVAVARPN